MCNATVDASRVTHYALRRYVSPIESCSWLTAADSPFLIHPSYTLLFTRSRSVRYVVRAAVRLAMSVSPLKPAYGRYPNAFKCTRLCEPLNQNAEANDRDYHGARHRYQAEQRTTRRNPLKQCLSAYQQDADSCQYAGKTDTESGNQQKTQPNPLQRNRAEQDNKSRWAWDQPTGYP